jgi:hypothetical protein
MHYPDMTGQAVEIRPEYATALGVWPLGVKAAVIGQHYGLDMLTVEVFDHDALDVITYETHAKCVRVVGPWEIFHDGDRAGVWNIVNHDVALAYDPTAPEDVATARDLVDMLNDLHLAEVAR